MGQTFSGPGGCIISSNKEPQITKCVPCTKYKQFPVDRTKSAGELISIFKALPSVTGTIEGSYWWLNCQFVPNDDSSLITTSSAYHLRNGMSSVFVKNVPKGRICTFYFEPSKLSYDIINRSQSATCPKIQIHPDSFCIFFLGLNEISFLHRNDVLDIHNKALEHHGRLYRSFAMSPDGRRTCILARHGQDYDLIIFGINAITYCDLTIHCSKLNKDFRGTSVRTELVDCKWSPDSSYVGASISTGYLLVFDIKAGEMVCSVFPDILDDSSLSSVSAFDFDPRSCKQIIAVGSTDGHLYIVNLSDGDVVCKSECNKRDTIDTVQYNPEGNIVGIALRSCKIILYDSCSCNCIFAIDMVNSCPELNNLPSQGNNPVIMRLDFTRSGEQLATCCCDGNIRIWQLPKFINLKFMCKLKILSLVSQGEIKWLPLPGTIKDYLLPLPLSL